MFCAPPKSSGRYALLWVARVIHSLYAARLVWLERRVELDHPELSSALTRVSNALEDVSTGIYSLLRDAAFTLEGYSVVCDHMRIETKMDTGVEVEIEIDGNVEYDISFGECRGIEHLIAPCRVKPSEATHGEPIDYTTCYSDTKRRGGKILIRHVDYSLYRSPVYCAGGPILFSEPGFELREATNVGRRCRAVYIVGVSPDKSYDESLLEIVFSAEIDFEKMMAKARVAIRARVGEATVPLTPVWRET